MAIIDSFLARGRMPKLRRRGDLKVGSAIATPQDCSTNLLPRSATSYLVAKLPCKYDRPRMMNRVDAAAILQIPPTASTEEARRAYQELFTEHQMRLTNAPTPALRNLYQARLRELDEARDAMSAETSADDTDLPLAEPMLPGGATPSWRTADSASAQPTPPPDRAPPATPPKPRDEPQPAPPPTATVKPTSSAVPPKPKKDLERDSGVVSDPPKSNGRMLIIGAVVLLIAAGGFYMLRGKGSMTGGSNDVFSPADTAVARSRARWIWVRINSGEKFEDIARKESDDSATAPKGGDLGTGAESRYGADFKKVANAITVPGTTAQPLLDSLGYDLIRLDRRSGNTLSLHRILVRIRHASDADLALVRQQLKENLAIAKTELGRGAYDNADHALTMAEAFTYQMAQPFVEDSLVAPLKSQLEEVRTKVDRACYAEDQIAKQRSEAPPCKYVTGFQRGWIR
jgi:hypothetical protein